ncbi:4-hydroxythreonine-4-phosphate dehydrogenase PdxA, partial [Salmonella enterica subsp. enterica serovar Anatum]|nr:4-hydroxythreonine-4-phosphate dehydrogenase PdxA [Salmonella enterica subsp. enterica serovar Anatum]
VGYVKPRIAVAGVNPHAGENGLFGDEETRILTPAITDARAKGRRRNRWRENKRLSLHGSQFDAAGARRRRAATAAGRRTAPVTA